MHNVDKDINNESGQVDNLLFQKDESHENTRD